MEKIQLHKIFYDTFTKEELNNIIVHATSVTENLIILLVNDNYFELSTDLEDKIDIFYYGNNTVKKQLTEDEFKKLYQNSFLQTP